MHFFLMTQLGIYGRLFCVIPILCFCTFIVDGLINTDWKLISGLSHPTHSSQLNTHRQLVYASISNVNELICNMILLYISLFKLTSFPRSTLVLMSFPPLQSQSIRTLPKKCLEVLKEIRYALMSLLYLHSLLFCYHMCWNLISMRIIWVAKL